MNRPFIVIGMLICHVFRMTSAQQQDPSTLNGGSAMAMAGDECVALAVDQRFGSGMQMVNVSPRRVLVPHSKLLLAFTGLESDVQSISEELLIYIDSKRDFGLLHTPSKLMASNLISPRSMATLTSNVLYSKRASPFYCEPIIAGLEEVEEVPDSTNRIGKRYRSFLCSTDILGAQLLAKDFVCSGAAKKSLYGTAEAMWKPGLGAEELGRVCARAFLSALERDCLSGYGARIYIITPEGIVEQEILGRSD